MKRAWNIIVLSLRDVFYEQRWLSILFLITIICLFLYSYTQVDLSLTLSHSSFLQDIEKGFQYIGYFNRPLSALLFTICLLLMVIFYLVTLKKALQGAISHKTILVYSIILAIVGTLSYTAFSYDIFNYIFDAKILTFYHQNPYVHKALDYPSDPMLSFMHWTHRTYPYGPVWLILTTPLSLLGLHYFVPTYFLFKAIAAASYLGSIILIGKIMRKVAPGKEVLAMAFFACNPLVIVESLVSAHNDIVMMVLALWSLYYLFNKRILLALVLLFLSIGVKFATLFLLPIYILLYLAEKKKITLPWNIASHMMIVVMVVAVLIASLRTTIQPWYLLFVFPFASLLADKYYVFLPSFIFSIILLANYLPFLFTGNWDPPIPNILFITNISALILSIILSFVLFLKKRRTSATS